MPYTPIPEVREERNRDDDSIGDTPEGQRDTSASPKARPLKRCTTFWGLVSAYWISDRWREAWALSVVVLAITALISKAAVWAATASADFIASLVEFHRQDSANPAHVILLSALPISASPSRRSAGLAFRHLVSTTLHRRAGDG